MAQGKSEPGNCPVYFLNNMITRRALLKLGLALTLQSMVPVDIKADDRVASMKKKRIYLVNPISSETVNTTYFRGGRYLPEALNQINHLFRDHLSGRIQPIDPGLIDLLHQIQQVEDHREPLLILSGYRSRRSNALLHKRNPLVAQNSYHIKGQAADIRQPGQTSHDLCAAAKFFQAGGVGYYPRRNFIHVDVGPVRYWRR